MRDLTRYLVVADLPRINWVYEFPNGHRPSVIVDHHRPFHFEIYLPGAVGTWRQLGADGSGLIVGLTTEQVEDRLAEIAALPKVEVSR